MRQTLSQRLQQRLSPQQIQLMKLLQIPTAVLEQRIKEELEVNPALEEGDNEEDEIIRDMDTEIKEEKEPIEDYEYEAQAEADAEENLREEFPFEDYFSEYVDDDEVASYKLYTEGSPSDEEEKNVPYAVENSFHEYLEQQLGMLDLNEHKTKVAKQIIGSIDEDGYLRRAPIAIADDLLFAQNITTTEEEVLAILKKIQRFDPPGIAARDLQECLYLQLLYREEHDDLDDEGLMSIRHAKRIIKDCFDEFSKKHFPKLQRQLGINEKQLKYAVDAILRLNPKPASGHFSSADRSVNYIVPDFIVQNRDGELDLSLNSRNAPDLRVSDQYKDMIREFKVSHQLNRTSKTQKEAIMFIKQKIDSAKWFIDAIRQRQETMFNTMYAILQYQYDFFLTGDEKKLRPMILKDVADLTGLDISTVSRVANSKYVQTEFGTKRLKDFFSESLQTESGEEVSTLEVKKILTDIIAAESKKKPHSDEKLKSMLQNKGYNIARRTVAKYREQLNIPVARLRKAL
jgi:RNA polymerase sigma-54 factor